jgi:hypothetical protein
VGAVRVGMTVGSGCRMRGWSAGFAGASRVGGGPAGLVTLIV